MINVAVQINTTIDHIKGRISHSRLTRARPAVLVWQVVQDLRRDDATHLAAGIAYFAIFSIFPLLLGIIAIMGLVLNSEELQQKFLDFMADSLPGSSEFVASNVSQIVRFRGALGIGAIIGLLWIGRAVFAAISRAINRAWGIRKDRPFYIAIPRQLAMTMIIGGLFVLSTVATSFIQLLNNRGLPGPDQGPLLDSGLTYLTLYLVPWAITLLVFLLIYRYVPNRPMRWRYIWPGALVAGVVFELAKILFLWYLENFAIFDQVYGSLASVIVLMFWAYLSAYLLILGAEICYEYERIYYPEDRSQESAPPESSPVQSGPPIC